MYTLTDDLMFKMFKPLKNKYETDKKIGGNFRCKNIKLINDSINALMLEKYINENINKNGVDYNKLKEKANQLKKLNYEIKKTTTEISNVILGKNNNYNVERTSKQCMAYFLRVHLPFFVSSLYADKFFYMLDSSVNINKDLISIIDENVIGKLYTDDEAVDYNDYASLKENICFIIWLLEIYNNAETADLYKLSNVNLYIDERSIEDEEMSFDESINDSNSITYAFNNYETSLLNIIYNHFKLGSIDFDIDAYKKSSKVLLSLIKSDLFKKLEVDEIGRLIYYFSRYKNLNEIISKKTYSFKDLDPLCDMIIRRKKDMKTSYQNDRLLHDIASRKVKIYLKEISKESINKIK